MSEPASIAQQSFLREQKRHRNTVRFLRVFILLVFLAVWEYAADTDRIDAFIFSSPSLVASTFLTMFTKGTIFVHIGITLFETLVSFALVIFLGIFTAVLLWMSTKLSEILEPYLVVLNSLPKSALAPLLIVWLGANLKTIVIAGISVAIFGSILSIYTGFTEVDPDKIKLIYTLGGHKREVLFKVVLPSSIPTLISTMKVNIGLSLVGVVIGEFLAARQGLGYLIIYSSQVFQLNVVIMSIILLCIIAMGLYAFINLLEKYYRKRI